MAKKEFLTLDQLQELGPAIVGFIDNLVALLDGDTTVDPADRALVGAHFLLSQKGAPAQNQQVRALLTELMSEVGAVDDLRSHFEVLTENLFDALEKGSDKEEEGADDIRLTRMDVEACRLAVFCGMKAGGAVFDRATALADDMNSELRSLDAELKQRGLIPPELE